MDKRILITGATGFLGGRLLEKLATMPGMSLIATGRNPARRAAIEALGAQYLPGDLADPAFVESLLAACVGPEKSEECPLFVVHCAALSSPWGKYEEFERANVISTRNLLEVSRRVGAKRFVNIGTPSIYANFTDRLLVSEADPLPEQMVNFYAATKLVAEREVLAANGQGIETISLRPRALIGRGDTVIFPRVLRAYEEGRLRIIGDGNNVSDVTCVSNVVEAILLAISAPASALGQSYNITNGEPLPLWELFRYIFGELRLPFAPTKISYALVDRIAAVMEWTARNIRKGKEPTLTRYSISTLAHSMTLDISLARTQLGYEPGQTVYEGIDEFLGSIKQT
ncbi:MAG: NAD-dependent epimerase/dehydratase family protein [Bacteroidia bacterium]|nr:NAD-dependent epimerase/dehydratase family protein [Bacteroidia bacterium]